MLPIVNLRMMRLKEYVCKVYMPQQRKQFRRRRRYARKGKRKSKKSATMMSHHGVVKIPRMPPRPDKLIPSVYKCTLHTRYIKQLDAGANPVDYSALQLSLNTAGKPIFNADAYAYGCSPKCWHVGGGVDNHARDLGNIYNFYEKGYVLSALVRAKFIASPANAASLTASTVALTNLIDGNADVGKSFGLLANGYAIGNFEEQPNLVMGTLGDTLEGQTITLQRGYAMKKHFMGKKAQSYIGNDEYATTWTKNNAGLTEPQRKVKAVIIQKDLIKSVDPNPSLVVVDVYQVCLFTDLRTMDQEADPTKVLTHTYDDYDDADDNIIPS